MITIAQLCGGLVGLAVAYGMYRFVEMVDAKNAENEAERCEQELNQYKQELLKSVK